MASTHVWMSLCLLWMFSAGKCQQQNTKECYTRSKSGVRYEGLLDISKSGQPCLPWNETELPFVGNHSYCRAPRPRDLQPWCYIQGRVSRLDVPCEVEHCKVNMGRCGGKHYGLEGTLYSPGSPGLYPGGVNCTWEINVPGNRIIQLRFKDRNIAYPTDIVDVQDMGYPLKRDRISQVNQGKRFLSSSNSVRVYFRSDPKSGGGQFTLFYKGLASCTTPTIPNGSLELDRKLKPDRALFKPGEEVNFTFSCDAGYRKCRKKRKSATCKNNGSWSKLPECRPEHHDTCDVQTSTETSTTQQTHQKTTHPPTAETTPRASTIHDQVTTVRRKTLYQTSGSTMTPTHIFTSSSHMETVTASSEPTDSTSKLEPPEEPNLYEGQKQGAGNNIIIIASAVSGCALLAVGVVTCIVISKRRTRARKRPRLNAAEHGQNRESEVVDDVLTYNFRTLANTAQIRLQIISTVDGAGSDPSYQCPDAGYATASMTKTKKKLPNPPGETVYQNAIMFSTAERASTRKDPSKAPAIYTKVKKNKRQVDSPGSTLGSQTSRSERDVDPCEAKVRPEPCPRTAALYAKVNKKRPPEPLPWELEELREPGLDPEVTYPELDHVQCHVAEVTEFLPDVTPSHSEGVYAEIRDIMVHNSRESSSGDSYNAYDKAAHGYSSE
ncbi:uncharacterized protein LOC144909975 isoform X2 [Branchiostoma floridae x Branchiostoma belcheri]